MALRVHQSVRSSRRAFSLVEMVMVAVIIGIVVAIAVPRLSNAADRSVRVAVLGNISTVLKAVELYRIEHYGRHPAINADGTLNTSGPAFINRLCGLTDDGGGTGSAEAIFGPYLRAVPANPRNQLGTVRIDGPPAGANTAGWRFDSPTGAFQPDDVELAAVFTLTKLVSGKLTAEIIE